MPEPDALVAAPEAALPIAVERATTEAPTEPVFVEIWRPAGRGDREHPPRHRRPQRAATPPIQHAGETPAPAPGGTNDANGAAETRPPRPQRHERPSHREGQDGDRPRYAGPRREGKDAPRREGKDGQRRERSDRPRREPRAAEPMRFSTEPPQGDKRNKPVDPDSPFAALAALKAQLEGRKPE